MALKTLSALPVFADSLFADRFNRIDRLFSQLTGDTPVALYRLMIYRKSTTAISCSASACLAGKMMSWK